MWISNYKGGLPMGFSMTVNDLDKVLADLKKEYKIFAPVV
jgi:hypothetical protein